VRGKLPTDLSVFEELLDSGKSEWCVVTSNNGDGVEIVGTRASTSEKAWAKAAKLMHRRLMRISSECSGLKPPY
jgi:hypothetical protein